MNYIIPTDKEDKLLESLEKRNDTETARIKRYLSMPDLSRTTDSPIRDLVDRVKKIDLFKDFDDLKVPEIVSADISFNLFNFPANHPARSRSDTYYIDDKNILRTHTTVSWYYYLTSDFGKEKIHRNESVGVLTYGKVYRKDEIDRNHMNTFHQIDGWYIIPKEEGVVEVKDLEEVLIKIVQAIFGPEIRYRFNPDTFPYTNPSLEMEIMIGDRWIEVLGCGVIEGRVLEKLGVDAKNYTGWAFGFGLERLAIISMDLPDIRLFWSEDSRVKKQLKLGQKYKEVSKYPPVVRDISFIVDEGLVVNDYFDIIRQVVGEDLVEEVNLLDEYRDDKKIGKGKKSYTFRITYRSLEKTLTNTEVDAKHKALEETTIKIYKAKVR